MCLSQDFVVESIGLEKEINYLCWASTGGLMRSFKLILSFVVLAGFISVASAQKRPELAPSPIMGWNSWNWFKKDSINQQIVIEIIDAMAENGLRDLGYNYIIVDGGWRDVKLGPGGELVAHPEKFPDGIKFLADYAHSRGFKFGLHTVPGHYDCGCDPVGGWGKEELHISQFVEWGLDYIKLDRCRFTVPGDKKNRGWTEENIQLAYDKWSRLIRNCGRDITFTICAYKFRDWYPESCNTARTTGDIGFRHGGGAFFERSDRGKPGYNSIMEIAEINNQYHAYAGNGYWNDMDILVIGEQGLTVEEQKAHFALWCIMSSPLYLGNDPRAMQPYEVDIITNREAIHVNQDPSGQGKRIVKVEGSEIWHKALADGTHAVLLLNREKGPASISLDLKTLGLKKAYIRDIYSKKNLGPFKGSYTHEFEGRGCVFLRIGRTDLKARISDKIF